MAKIFSIKATNALEFIVSIFTITSIVYCAYTIYSNASLIFGDQHYVLAPLSEGKTIKPFIMPSIGRFVPFAVQEFNFISYLSTDALTSVYFILSIKFTLFCLFTYLSLKQVSSNFVSILGCMLCCLISLPQMHLFTKSFSPENSILPLLAFFIFCYCKATKKDQPSYYILAGIAALTITYLKEPSFAVFLTIGITNFIFRKHSISKYEKIISAFFILNAVIFLSIYCFYIYPQIIYSYTSGRTTKSILFTLYDFLNYTYWIPVYLPIIRLLHFYRSKKIKICFEDALLAGGISYGAAYVVLQFSWQQYFLPSIFLLLFVAIRYLSYYLKKLEIKYTNFIENNPKYYCIKAIVLSLIVILLAYPTIITLNTFSRQMAAMARTSSVTLEFLNSCVKAGFTPLYWLPPQEDDKRYTWVRGEHFAKVLPIFYQLYTKQSIDISRHEQTFYDGLMLDKPKNCAPFAIINDFDDFLSQKAILLVMPGDYENKPWLLDKKEFLLIRTTLCETIIKTKDLEIIRKFSPLSAQPLPQ